MKLLKVLMSKKKYQPSIDIVTNKDLDLSVEEFIDGLFRNKENDYPRATDNISGEEYYPEISRLR